MLGRNFTSNVSESASYEKMYYILNKKNYLRKIKRFSVSFWVIRISQFPVGGRRNADNRRPPREEPVYRART